MKPTWLASRYGYLAIALLTVGCDQVSKRVAAAELMGTPRRSYLGDSFRLEYTENAGAFLGLGANLPAPIRTALFTVGSSILLGAVLVSAIRNRWPLVPRIGLCLIMAGGLSNLVDRVVRGRVIDFMNVGIGPIRTGIFNVADMALMAGIALVLFARHRPPDGAPGSVPST